MRSMYSRLYKNVIFLVLVIYPIFLISLFFIDFIHEYQQTNSELSHLNQSKKEYLTETIDYFYYYNNQIISTVNLEESKVLSFEPLINDTEIYLLNNIFTNNRFFDNFMILDERLTKIYYYNEIKNEINIEIFKDIKVNTILINNLLINDNNNLYIITKYDNNYYFVYFFSEKNIEEFLKENKDGFNFYIQDKDGSILISDYANKDQIKKINIDTDKDFVFEDYIISYYNKVSFFNEDYYFVTQIPLYDVLSKVFSNSLMLLVFSVFILSLTLFITKIKINNVVKKPFTNFINEIESLSEKDFVNLTTLKENETTYTEFSKLLSEFKKISLYNKNNYENIIQELNNELNQANESNKSKTLFLANMSHEMRTPLNSIIGYTQLTKKIGFDNKEKVQEYFECINNSSDILLQKINDILDLSKIESKQFELNLKTTQIRCVVKEMHDLLDIQAQKKNLEFSYYVDPQIPKYLDVDGSRLKQILMNLCFNGIKFTEKGYVKLEVELFGYTNDSVVLEYIISDTGCGIPKDKIDKIFIPFVQVDNNNSLQLGTGLGLTIARDLIRMMGGDITVTSKENVGTIFTFTTIFKISDDLNKEVNNNKEVDNELFISYIKNKKILIAEDNTINQIFMKEIFSVFQKKDIDIASDGNEAIEMCKNKNYDIILMDIQMPKMSGIDATKVIRSMEKYNYTPIIALTANAFSEQITEYLKIGMNDYLPKPVDINRFKRVIMNNL